MDEVTRKKIKTSIKDLPTLPTIATQIFSITSNPDSTVEDLKRIISTDQVVAGRIMKAVNSAYYGFPRQIDNLSKAIVILGFNNVRSITLSVSMMEVYSKSSPSGIDYNELWAHAVGTAHCTRALARDVAPRNTEQFFVAGLLHDIGIVAINQCFPEEFNKCMKRASERKRPFYEIENEIFGFDHADVGEFIADSWLLPDILVKSIGCHHKPQDAVDAVELAYAVHTADILCKLSAFGDFGDNEPFTLDSIYEPAKNMFGIGKEGLTKELKKDIIESIEEAAGFIKGLS